MNKHCSLLARLATGEAKANTWATWVGSTILAETRRAIQFFEQCLAIARGINDRRDEGNALWNISLALDQLGERAQAIQHAEQALIIRDQIEDPNAEKVRAQLAVWREQTKHVKLTRSRGKHVCTNFSMERDS